MVWPRTPPGSADSTTTFRDRSATSPRNSPSPAWSNASGRSSVPRVPSKPGSFGQAGVQVGVPVRVDGGGAGDVDGAEHGVGRDVVGDGVAGSDEDHVAGPGHPPAGPGGGGRPRAGPGRCHGRLGGDGRGGG